MNENGDNKNTHPIVITGEQIAHFLWGLVSALVCVVNIGLTFAAIFIFLVYEMNQDWRKDDFLDEEFAEMGCGFFLGMVILILGAL